MMLFFTNLLLTLVIEVVFNYVLFRKRPFAPSLPRVVVANIISNPLAQVAHRMFFVNLWLVELFVVLFESVFYFSRGKQYREALIVSLLLNLSSVLVGMLIHSLKLVL